VTSDVPNASGTDRAILDLRRKLREERGAHAPTAETPALVYRRDLPQPSPRPVTRTRAGAQPVPLHEAVTGAEIGHATWGCAFLRTTVARDVCRHGDKVHRRLMERCGASDAPMLQHLASLRSVAQIALGDLLFLDLETAGLANAPVFLVGLMAVEGEDLVITQYLARTYAEEAAITAHFVAELQRRGVLVTFNGKTFDLPYMRVRAAATGVPFCCKAAHLDLLHVSRRAWRDQVPDCKLQTLERRICGRYREDDIPGTEVPEAYHAFVHTGDATDIARIMDHNARDLLTLADLLARIPDEHWQSAAR